MVSDLKGQVDGDGREEKKTKMDIKNEYFAKRVCKEERKEGRKEERKEGRKEGRIEDFIG